jgi:hypothetical protein
MKIGWVVSMTHPAKLIFALLANHVAASVNFIDLHVSLGTWAAQEDLINIVEEFRVKSEDISERF